MERVACQIRGAVERAGHTSDEFTNQALSPIRVFRRWPMLNRPLEVLRFARRFSAVLKSYDVVIGHGLYGAFISHSHRIYLHHNTFAGEALAIAGYIRPQEFFIARHLYGAVDRLAGKNAVRVAVGRSVAGETERLYHQSAHHIIHNAIDTAHFRPYDKHQARAHFGLPQDRWIGLVVGRVDTRKGVHTLNALAPRLPRRAGLAFAAPSVSPHLNISEHSVVLVRPVPYEEMPVLYAACDALVFPSLYESFGLVLIEALACGLPVITSRVGIVHEMLGQEPAFDSMVVQDPHNAGAFVDCVKRLIDEPEIGCAQVAWGMPYVRENFSLDRFNRAYTELIADVLAH